jgi:hypothetical protein
MRRGIVGVAVGGGRKRVPAMIATTAPTSRGKNEVDVANSLKI